MKSVRKLLHITKNLLKRKALRSMKKRKSTKRAGSRKSRRKSRRKTYVGGSNEPNNTITLDKH